MYYNIAIKGGFLAEIQFVFGVTDIELKKLIQAYDSGKDSIMISGKKITLIDCSLFKIFTVKKHESFTPPVYKNDIARIMGAYGKYRSKEETLRDEGEEVTSEFILGDWGEKGQTLQVKGILKEFIHASRIVELENIKTEKFDFTKLIQLCNELNSSFSSNNYFATGALARAILDHIPPVFGFDTFIEVANNYNSPGSTRSFSKIMKQLNEFRNISDKYLHSIITKRETLPNERQVDCKRDLDVLLEEIVRIFK